MTIDPRSRFGAPEDAMVFARNVRKSFGPLEVLKGVDIVVTTGTVACIIGPSGSGKSTFLRCINHLEKLNGCLDLDNMRLGCGLFSRSVPIADGGYHHGCQYPDDDDDDHQLDQGESFFFPVRHLQSSNFR